MRMSDGVTIIPCERGKSLLLYVWDGIIYFHQEHLAQSQNKLKDRNIAWNLNEIIYFIGNI